MKKLIILFILLFPLVSAMPIHVIETNLETYEYSVSEGYETNTNVQEGDYEVQLIKGNEVLHKQYFNADSNVEIFPGPECFDEEMRLIETCEGITNRESEVFVRLQIPIIEGGEYLEVLHEGSLLFSIDLREKDYTKYWILISLIIIIAVAFIFMRKYYKKQKNNQNQVIQ